MSVAIAALAVSLVGVPTAWAQVTAPRAVEFTASADHFAVLPDGRAAVSAYQIEFLLLGASQPFHVAGIGKPVPGPTGLVTHDLSATAVAWPVAGGTYEVRITAVGPNGQGRSAPSAPFAVGTNCTVTVSPTSPSVAAGGGSVAITVTAPSGCAWTASSAAAWITASPASGSGNGSVTLTVVANAAGTSRTGTVTVAGRTVTVTQAAAACTFSVSPTSPSVAAGGGSVAITVTAPSGCAWTASSATSWITVNPASGGGNGSVTLTVAANAATSPRTGTVTVAGQTITVTQAAAAAPVATGPAVYEVGPDKAAASLADVPWDTLAPGALVRVHWRPEPYREKWVISASGTAESPIVIRGVPSPTGALPVIDGSGAVTAGPLPHPADTLGVVGVAPATDTAPVPSHIVIEGLDIRGARPPATFLSANGLTTTYAAAAASLYLENAADVVVRNCVLRDSGQGLVVASTGTGASRRVTVTGNHIHSNGNAGSALEHNARTEAIGVAYEGNRFGPLTPGALGNGIDDRSAGLVVRANWVEGGARELELLDARSAVVRAGADYRRAFVYGNVILQPPGTDSPVVVRYGGDSGKSSRYRQGLLHFYNNTVVSARTTGTILLELSTFLERADVRNNIVSVPAGGLTLAQRSGTVDLGRNWLQAGYLPTAAGFAGTFDDAGLTVQGTAPGFVGAASQDFRLASGSPAIDVATTLASEALPANDVTQQYVPHRQAAGRVSVGVRDLGALERGVSPSPAYSISGRVADAAGVPLANVLVSASGGFTGSARSDARGLYTLAGVKGGSSVTVWPSLDRYAFTPASAAFTAVSGDRAADFVGSLGANQSPSVSLTAPSHGATFAAPASVALAATATDNDGSVARVEFYRDATRVASDTSAPYTATLTGLAAGSYTITATAVDDRGAMTTSTPAVISVNAAASSPAVVMTARADTYVAGGVHASTIYGGATTLFVRKSATANDEREAYLLYKLTTATAGRRVLLRLAPALTAASAVPVRVEVFGVPSIGWTDTTFTWATRPASEPTPIASVTVASTTTTVVDIDVTAYVQAIQAKGWTRAAFALKGAAATPAAVAFPSREAGGPTPVLVVQ